MRWTKLIKNRYFWVTLAFVVWMIFFDENNVLKSTRLENEIRSLEKQEQFYKNEISDLKRVKKELSSNKANLEKFAREKYLMKKDGETVFRVKREKE